MERAMHRGQALVANLEAAGLPDPGQATFHHVADRTQAAAVGRPRPRQVVLDPPLLQPLPIARRAVLAIPVQGVRPASPAAARLSDRRHVVQQRHRLQRLVAVRCGDAHGQRRPIAIDEEVPGLVATKQKLRWVAVESVAASDLVFAAGEDHLDALRQFHPAHAERYRVVGNPRWDLLRPELRGAHLHKPLTMLLFGMINWTFTWLRPDGALTYEAVAPMVADLFFGGLGAVRTEAADPAPRDPAPQVS